MLTKSSISTVTKPTRWRLFKFINIKAVALLYFYLRIPMTTTSSPVKADFTIHRLTDIGGMGGVQPAWGVGSTVVLWYTGSGHPTSSCSGKAVPVGRCKVFLITLKDIASRDSCSSFCVIQLFVMNAFVKGYNKAKGLVSPWF